MFVAPSRLYTSKRTWSQECTALGRSRRSRTAGPWRASRASARSTRSRRSAGRCTVRTPSATSRTSPSRSPSASRRSPPSSQGLLANLTTYRWSNSPLDLGPLEVLGVLFAHAGHFAQDRPQVGAQVLLGEVGVVRLDGVQHLAVLGDHLLEVVRHSQAQPADAVEVHLRPLAHRPHGRVAAEVAEGSVEGVVEQVE